MLIILVNLKTIILIQSLHFVKLYTVMLTLLNLLAIMKRYKYSNILTFNITLKDLVKGIR